MLIYSKHNIYGSDFTAFHLTDLLQNSTKSDDRIATGLQNEIKYKFISVLELDVRIIISMCRDQIHNTEIW